MLATHRATFADLVIRVDATTMPASTDAIELRVLVRRASGSEAGLDRSYTLAPSDCASATELVALGIDRFLDAFPDWAAAPLPRPPEPMPARWFELSLLGAANAMFDPIGVDAHVGGALDIGDRRHRVGGTLHARASVPQAAGSGSFQQTSMLVGATYRLRSDGWRLRAEVRAGALVVTGVGLDTNRSDWLPWWEGAVFAGRDFAWGALGVEVAASALQHRAVTSDGLVEEDIPLLRLGVAGEFDVWSSKP